jgi:membrane dipeptidase
MTSGTTHCQDLDCLARAQALHDQTPVILVHDHEPPRDDLERCRAGGICGKVSLPVLDVKIQGDPLSTGMETRGWARHATAEFARTLAQIRQAGKRMRLVTRAQDFSDALTGKQVAVLLGSEGGKLIEGSLARLQTFYRLGYRFMGLTWAYPNQISYLDGQPEPGLTRFGRQLVPELNRLGILIDVGHAGQRTFFQLLELSGHPILMSHGGAQGAVKRSRHPDWPAGLGCFCDDEMLRALAQTGGLLGINFVGHVFYRDNGFCDITLDDVIAHFDYVTELVGPDVLALGCDYFPTTGAWAELQRRQNSPVDSYVVRKERLWEFTAALLQRGWREADIINVLGGNFLRLCRRVLGE